MADENENGEMYETPFVRRAVPHYYGDTVRTLMVTAAVFIFIAETLWRSIPLSLSGTIIAIIVLTVFAGLTNPNIRWVHYVNMLIAAWGTFIFGREALVGYGDGRPLFEFGFLSNEILAVISVLMLYFAIKTVRGMALRRRLRKEAEERRKRR